MSILKNSIRAVLNPMGFEVVNYRAHKQNEQKQIADTEQRLALLATVDKLVHMISHSTFPHSEQLNEFEFLRFSLDNLIKSKSQLFQDLFVLYYFRNKKNGFFIEFGATDGVTLSNTFLLEKEFGWKGILCEPGKIWKSALLKNRQATIDNRCVWSKSGEQFNFNEAPIAELSTIETFNDSDFHSEARKSGLVYTVETVSLNDLLAQHNAPSDIDYLSIDTEGSEFEILQAFDFIKYNIRIITVEHNFSPKRAEIYDLLIGKGYKRVFDSISSFDDWYVKA